MSENVYGLVEKIEISGPNAGKNGKPDYDRVIVTMGGEKYSKITNVGADLPIEEGKNAHLFFSTVVNGKFTNRNIIKMEKSTKTGDGEAKAEVVTTESKTVQKKAAAQTSTTSVTSKDTSMEVSGLLQALINSGIAQDNLEESLRVVLRLKRKVAQELEAKGTV